MALEDNIFAHLIPAAGPGAPAPGEQAGLVADAGQGGFIQGGLKPTEEWRDATPEEVTQSGRNPQFKWQRNAAGEWRSDKEGTAAGASLMKQQESARNVLTTAGVDLAKGVDPVRALIEGSTSGKLETFGANLVGSATGEATPGMENIGKLKTLASTLTLQLTGGSLGANISNTDRDFIVEQLGDIANPQVPANQRLAAWEQVKERMGNLTGIPYKAGQPAPVPPPPPGMEQQGAPGAPAAPGAPPGGVPPAPGQPPPNPDEIQFGADERNAALKRAQDHRDEYEQRVARGDTIEQLNAWRASIGAGPMPEEDAKTITGARERGEGVGVQAVTQEMIMTPEERARVDAAAHPEMAGAEQAKAAGGGAREAVPFLKQLEAGAASVGEAMRGEGSFGERYERNRLMQDSLLEKLDAEHPGWFLGGELAAAAAMPTGVEGVAMKAGQEAYRAARLAGEAAEVAKATARTAARKAVALQVGKEGAAYGGAQGGSQAGSAEAIIPSMLAGAALGGTTGAALGAVPLAAAPAAAKFGEVARRGIDEVDRAAAKAGEALGLDIPEFIVGGLKARNKAANLQKGGSTEISKATQDLLDASEAELRGQAEDVGRVGDDLDLGRAGVTGGTQASRREHNRLDNLYTQARKGAEGTDIEMPELAGTLNQISAKEAEAVGGSTTGDAFRALLDDLRVTKKGMMTIDGARQTRTTLRDKLTNDVGLTRKNATRLTNMVMRAITKDMEAGLKAAGKENVFKLFQEADSGWRRLQILEDKVLEPYIGKEGDKGADEVAAALANDAKGKGVRLARFLNAVPPEYANQIRASLIARLGRPPSGQQNAAGDAFSLDMFLTNWDKIRNSKNLIFPKETVKSMEKLAQIAEAAKRAAKSKEPSGRTVQQAAATAVPIIGGAVGFGASGDWKGSAAGGILLPIAAALSRGRSAKLLASPKFAERLARMPSDPKAALSYWERPWVAALAKANPEISNEILGFREEVLKALGAPGTEEGIEAPKQ